MNVRIGTLLTAACLLGGCSWGGGDGRDRNPANRPGYLRPGETTAAPAPHTVRGRGEAIAEAATFVLVNGSDAVRVRVGELGDDLFEVATPKDAKAAPSVAVDGTTVIAGLRDTGRTGPAVVSVVLDDDVRWLVRLGGGAADESVDLTGGPGGDVELTGGTSRAEVALPAAKGRQRVTMSGGAGTMVVRLGGDAPVRVAARNGAGSVTVDGQTYSGVAGGSMWTPDTWANAPDSYDVDATAGVSSLMVERL
jgi:hypothetical protein